MAKQLTSISYWAVTRRKSVGIAALLQASIEIKFIFSDEQFWPSFAKLAVHDRGHTGPLPTGKLSINLSGAAENTA